MQTMIAEERLSTSSGSERDLRLLRRCIDLSREAVRHGEYPFAAMICRGEDVVVAATNRVKRDRDVTRHAEMLALSEAQERLGTTSLHGCTLYTNVEPCPMCSFMIRETGISRVVFALRSPLMGGVSRWKILSDETISSRMPEVFGRSPEIVGPLLARDAARVWRRWNPIAWGVIRFRGVLARS